MNTVTMNVLGFPAANRDLTVEVRDPLTNDVVRTARPFLDGTVRMTNIDPGAYEVLISHPNLALPVVRRPLRILPVGDTRVSILIDPSQFRNTPIADIPDANLGPVRDTVSSVGETVLPLAHKQPGEAIRSDDWNAMASAIHEMANSVAELTRLVSPTGHDHPELKSKFDEMTGNFDQLVNTLSAAMTELQRQIQAQRYRRQIDDLIRDAGDLVTPDVSDRLYTLVGTLETNVTESPVLYARRVRDVGVQLTAEISQVLEAQPQLSTTPSVTTLTESTDLLRTQQANSYMAELEFHRRTDRILGAGGLAAFRVGGS
jgi:hypothetical protein